jgi:signal transduction histidine kinase
MCNRVNGEKKLLALVNATVSHEMRNPLNSIHSQILNQSKILDKLQELVDSDVSFMSVRKLKK